MTRWWMGEKSKEKRDIYYRMAKKNGYRARSAFKLLHIEEEYKIFDNVQSVVDLCAAPGSWSQVAAKILGKEHKIISVDIQEIHPLENVIFLQEDITTESCKNKILSLVSDKIDLVLFDGAPDVTGIIDIDEYHQTVLLKEALMITTQIAKPGSTFVGKCFRSEDTGFVIAHFQKFYESVKLLKPRSSRNSSHECFLLCRGFHSSEHDPLFLDVDIDPPSNELFSCGKGPNSDLSTLFDDLSLPQNPSPIDPPFKEVVDTRREISSRKYKK